MIELETIVAFDCVDCLRGARCVTDQVLLRLMMSQLDI